MEQKQSTDKRFALLIDADNVSAKYIKPILDELSKYGTVTYKRIYGDWTLSMHAKWKDALLENSISPIQQFSYTYGKNSTDSAMIIDAMDILYTESVDGFCIVSSDSDFTRLASRLRESGRTVIGMGEKKTPTPFRRACDIFVVLELLLDNRRGKVQSGAEGPSMSKAEVEQAVVDIITDNQNNGKATGLGEVGSRLLKRYPDFDVRNYGTNLLSKLLEEFTRVTITKDRSSVAVELTDAPAPATPLEGTPSTENSAPESVTAEPAEVTPKEDSDEGARQQNRNGRNRRSRGSRHINGRSTESAVPDTTEEPSASPEVEVVIEIEPAPATTPKKPAKRTPAAKAAPDTPVAQTPETSEPADAANSNPAQTRAPKKAQAPRAAKTPQKFIANAVTKAGKQGMPVALLGNQLRSAFKGFKVQDLGYPQLRSYLASVPEFSVEKVDGTLRVHKINQPRKK